MQTEYLPVDKSREGQKVEQVRKVFPYGGVAVLAQTLVVEAVHLSDLSGLVVAAQYRYSLPVSDLQFEQRFIVLMKIGM